MTETKSTQEVVTELSQLKEQEDSIGAARRQDCPDGAWVIQVLEKLRAIVLEQSSAEQLPTDVEVARGLVAGLIGEEAAVRFIARLPGIRTSMALDVKAAYECDPAANSFAEIVTAYPSIHAVSTYRIAHEFYELGYPVVARIMSERAHGKTGIDIHPGATIGSHFFIDHGTGVVIGETTIIGDWVKIYHGVTVGAFSNRAGRRDQHKKRHPTIEDEVTIYPNATILGGDTVVGRGSVIGGNAWLTESVAPYTKVLIEPPRLELRTPEAYEI
jgi:serine O-acetyltransferase